MQFSNLSNLTDYEALSVVALIINMSIGIVLSLAVKWHLWHYGSILSNREDLGRILPFILLTTLLIITVVKSSLALSLGLVGALSIVRFRTPIKEPEELAYLFLVIAIGLGLGANQRWPTIVATFVILGVMMVLQYQNVRKRQKRGKHLYLTLRLKQGEKDTAVEDLQRMTDLLSSFVEALDIRRIDSHPEMTEVTYIVDLKSADSFNAILKKTKEELPTASLSFIDSTRIPAV